jgi:predicted dehydrogenase
MSSATLRFPEERSASFTCGYGASGLNSYHLVGTKGDLRMQPAFTYTADLKSFLTTGNKTKEKTFPVRDQFAPELDYFADCIQHHRDPEPSGTEGLADIRVVEALNESAAGRHPVRLPHLEYVRRPAKSQEISRPAVEEPDLIHVKSPTGKK